MEIVAALIIIGGLLLLLETVLPGLICGIIGVCCILAGVVLAYTRIGPPIAHYIFMGVAIGLLVGTVLWLKYFPTSKLASPLISKSHVGDIGTERPDLLNKKGIAHTNLRPSGTAIIDGERVDVVTEGSMIQRGAALEVVAVEGMRVVVREI
jgi:membrane-bound serine protease (ClpP class)